MQQICHHHHALFVYASQLKSAVNVAPTRVNEHRQGRGFIAQNTEANYRREVEVYHSTERQIERNTVSRDTPVADAAPAAATNHCDWINIRDATRLDLQESSMHSSGKPLLLRAIRTLGC